MYVCVWLGVRVDDGCRDLLLFPRWLRRRSCDHSRCWSSRGTQMLTECLWVAAPHPTCLTVSTGHKNTAQRCRPRTEHSSLHYSAGSPGWLCCGADGVVWNAEPQQTQCWRCRKWPVHTREARSDGSLAPTLCVEILLSAAVVPQIVDVVVVVAVDAGGCDGGRLRVDGGDYDADGVAVVAGSGSNSITTHFHHVAERRRRGGEQPQRNVPTTMMMIQQQQQQRRQR